MNEFHKTLDIWVKFMDGKPLGKHAVPAHVLRGWKLSREYGIDPFEPITTPILSAIEFKNLLVENKLLMQASTPMLSLLSTSIRGTGYITTLSLASGHILAVEGDEDSMEEARKQHNILGAYKHISKVGTTAIYTSICEKKPIILQGPEHYNRYLHDWCCASAPIFHMGSPIASITISSHISRRDRHTLALAQSCAEAISIRMQELVLQKNKEHLNFMLQTVYDSLPDMTLAVNAQGILTHANKSACTFLGIDRKSENIHLSDFIALQDFVRVKELHEKGTQGILGVEVTTPKGPKNMTCRFSPIKGKSKNLGMLISISNQQDLIDLTKRVVGNYAKYSFDDIKGENEQLKKQIVLASKAANSGHRILLNGESGTGKELFAQAIHNISATSKGPFVAISCAAIPRDLIESELFGYVGGAFTGARRNGMVGKFELASNGTLFLDEINSLPLEMQVKLLRVLQQMEIIRIGDTKPTPINVRIIAATNKDLRQEVALGNFREDLYFRLNVIEICIPPLRERKDDISLLAHLFLRRQSSHFQYITNDAIKALYSYAWPGNVRELDNICERALLLSEDGIITVQHLPAQVTSAVEQSPVQLSGQSAMQSLTGHISTPILQAEVFSEKTMRASSKELIYKTLEQCGGNISKAAAQMGVARSTLYRRLRKYEES